MPMRVVVATLVFIVIAAIAVASSAFAADDYSIMVDGKERSCLVHVPRAAIGADDVMWDFFIVQ